MFIVHIYHELSEDPSSKPAQSQPLGSSVPPDPMLNCCSHINSAVGCHDCSPIFRGVELRLHNVPRATRLGSGRKRMHFAVPITVSRRWDCAQYLAHVGTTCILAKLSKKS